MGYDAIIEFIKKDDYETVKSCLKHNPKVFRNIQWHTQEYTPLNVAVNHSSILMLQLLLHHGLNINQKDQQGFTPLHCALTNYRRKKHMLSFLLENKADQACSDKKSLSPLCYCIKEKMGYDYSAMDLLYLNRPNSINRPRSSPPIFHALKVGNPFAFKWLILKNVHLNIKLPTSIYDRLLYNVNIYTIIAFDMGLKYKDIKTSCLVSDVLNSLFSDNWMALMYLDVAGFITDGMEVNLSSNAGHTINSSINPTKRFLRKTFISAPFISRPSEIVFELFHVEENGENKIDKSFEPVHYRLASDAIHKQYHKTKLDLFRERIAEIVMALQEKDISALELMTIIDCAIPHIHNIPFHSKWNIITKVKHFKKPINI